MRFKPIGMQHFVVAEFRGHRDLGLERVADKVLRPLARDHDLAALVGGHIDLEVVGLEGEARIGHLEGHPPPGGERLAELPHLGVIQFGGIGRELLGRFGVRSRRLRHGRP